MSNRGDVLGLCISRLGYRKGARVAAFMYEWEYAVRQVGHPLGIEEFADWWKESRATAYRRQGLFREAFPELGPTGTPNDLLGPTLERLSADLDQQEAQRGAVSHRASLGGAQTT
jgi:hypothetical protein